MESKEPAHSKDTIHGAASSSLTSPHVGDYEDETTEQKGIHYEVFLSFKGKDTGKGFTDYLYTSLVDAGILVFRDDKELHADEQTITQSKISIPTISENYASSKWCLRELALILKCKRKIGQIVLPIFYKVKPLQVRYLAGRLRDAINTHKKNLDETTVKEWEEALQEVSSLEGWESETVNDGHEGALVKMVVNKVKSELKGHFQLIIPKQLVGIDDRVKQIMSFLQAEFNGTRIIGIYGMGGIGKTTLAKVLYNQLSSRFDYLSFVANIRETSQQHKGIECLQKQLIHDVLRSPYDMSSVDEGIGIIKSRFTSKKVLILLDDVDANTQLNALVGDASWFETGSIVIITTRTQSILDEARVDYMYQLKELSLDQSLILFSRHAFQKDSPQSDYEVISRDVVSITAGLPLALEIIGSFLHGKRQKVWIDTLKKLKKVPAKKVQETLTISYDALNYEEQQIFLDIACFFIGSSKESLIYMWDSCGFFPEEGIEALILKSLLKMDKHGKLMMHDQLRDLGREIIRLENPKKPHKRSRLWTYEEAAHVLDNKGTGKIEALCLDKYDSRNYTGEQFKDLTNLRFLRVKGGNFKGDFQNLFPQLRWLQWEQCPLDFLATNFHPKRLVVLDLSRSEISENWRGWDLLKMAMELKVLNLTGCQSLRRTPDLSTWKSLEILILEDCKNLEEIHSSIEDITTLVSLNVSRCGRLEKLPIGVGRMENLRELLLDHTAVQEIPISKGCLMKLKTLRASSCRRLNRLPESIGSLVLLTQLNLDLTRIEELPESIGSLKELETLYVSYCSSLASIPSAIGHLASLSVLDLTQCDKLTQLPNSVGLLVSLERLLLRGCSSLKRIHNWIGKLGSLTELDLKFTAIAELPESIGNLQKLKILDICGAPIRKFPVAIGMLLNLEELRASHCENLEGVPSTIGKLISLNKLDLDKSGIWGLPESISELSSLQNLRLEYCMKLREIPELPSGLTALGVTCQSPLLPHLSQLTLLKKLALSDCCCLEYLPELPIGLLVLSITRCGKLKALTNLSNLEHLSELMLEECFELTEVTGLDGLQTLSKLYVRQCPKISRLDGDGSLESLRALDINEVFPNFPKLTNPTISQPEGLLDLSNSKILRETTAASCVKKSHLKTTPLAMIREVYLPSILPARQSIEKTKGKDGPQPAYVETSEGNYAIAAAENVVGIDDHVKHIMNLLEMEVDDEVRIIGICGADGIGKTTLAKAVYNRISSCFNSRSFLAEVEEITENPSGIQFLQTKLMRDILERDHESPFDVRIESFLDMFRELKVLIVVDDVENRAHLHAIVGDQLHWFGSGSRIIVTSKNSGILQEYDPGKACIYMVRQLDNGQAFELFCRHAFGMQSSINGYDGLAHHIVNAIVKLPLVVEVIGSFLRGKPMEEWRKMEKLMKQVTASSQKTMVGCKEILDICYNALDPKQKQIFLDIALFISGVDARIASYMWPNSFLPSSDCFLMPLAKIGENNELHMHRLLRSLGKRILDQEESEYPIPRKFCIHDMVPSAISREKGMENVEALCFDLDDNASCIFTAGDFESMPNTRFLKLDSAKVSGDFAGSFQNLRWLCWQRCPLDFGAKNIILRELVILDLSWSKVTEDWGGWSEIKMERLKVLNLTGCSSLLITPNFSGFKDLEILILEKCSHLVKLDSWIGHLKHLISLNLKFCSQLNKLPVELGCLTALKELFIDGTSVREIPISIGNLKHLKVLSGFKCLPLTYLPSSISYLTALSVLSLDGSKVAELPSLLGDLLNLKRLSLRDCRYVQELPDSIGRMGSSLEELDISATGISKLPDSIRNLQKLRVLKMDSSFLRAFPGEIGNLTKLEELHASWCRSLKGAIPGDIRRLHHLRSLTLGNSGISSLPFEIYTISSLHTLDLLQCNEIEVLPELPPSLICLRVSSKRMKSIPPLKDLKELEELCLSDEGSKEHRPPSEQLMPVSKMKRLLSTWFSRIWYLELIQTQSIDKKSFSISSPKLRKLELCLSQIISLHLVYGPTDVPQLKTLILCGLNLEEVSELPKTLSVLSIRDCSSLKTLPTVQGLTSISVFELYNSAIEEIEGLEELKALKRLDISSCKIKSLNGIGQLTSLRSLILFNCPYLEILPNLSNLKLLKVLEIRRCGLILRIEGLDELTSLEKFNISECWAENSVPVQNTLKRGMTHSMGI